jgi:superfamily II RNA helicase
MNREIDDLILDFMSGYPFHPDDFQIEAMRRIAMGDSVIVSAPTGAGKTLIAEFAIYLSFMEGKRIIYTTPLKALSNQKYSDFGRKFGEENVGIVTGDVKINPKAPVVIMTTEILRNLLFEEDLSSVGYIVLDECHYMGDEGRGTVWEEVVVNCPKHILIIALSATVSNVDEIADWISTAHRTIVPIKHFERPVPLQYLFVLPSGKAIPVPEGAGKGLDVKKLGIPRIERRRTLDHVSMVEEMKRRGWLPAIYFIFSRIGCENALMDFLDHAPPLINKESRARVERIIQEFLENNPSASTGTDLNSLIIEGLRKGVGIHHAGILPAMKRLTEILFEEGLVGVVFATETMSLGIHMPAKAVFISSLRKRTDFGFRRLMKNELTQMAGRAGRRGIDPEGKCLIAITSEEDLQNAIDLINADPEPVVSWFRISYSSAALLYHHYNHDMDLIRKNIESSFGQFQNNKAITRMRSEISKAEAHMERIISKANCPDFEKLMRYMETKEPFKASRDMPGSFLSEEELLSAPPGSVVLVRKRSKGSIGVLLGTRISRKGRVIADILFPDPIIAHVPLKDIKKILSHIPPFPLEQKLLALKEEAPGKRRKDIKEKLMEMGGIWEELRRLEIEKAGEEESLPCHICQSQERCRRIYRKIKEEERRIKRKKQELDSLKNSYWNQFLRMMELLERFGYIVDGELSEKGRMISHIRHDNELMVVETVFSGVLDPLDPPEIAAVLSCLIEEPRGMEKEGSKKDFLKSKQRIRRALLYIKSIKERIESAQEQIKVYDPVSIHTSYLIPVYNWASGEGTWEEIVDRDYGGHEGDLIRAMRRLIDLMRQITECPETPVQLHVKIRKALESIDRDIVKDSALLI